MHPPRRFLRWTRFGLYAPAAVWLIADSFYNRGLPAADAQLQRVLDALQRGFDALVAAAARVTVLRVCATAGWRAACVVGRPISAAWSAADAAWQGVGTLLYRLGTWVIRHLWHAAAWVVRPLQPLARMVARVVSPITRAIQLLARRMQHVAARTIGAMRRAVAAACGRVRVAGSALRAQLSIVRRQLNSPRPR